MNLPAYLKSLRYIEVPYAVTRVNHIVILAEQTDECYVDCGYRGISDMHCRKQQWTAGLDIRQGRTSSKFGPSQED